MSDFSLQRECGGTVRTRLVKYHIHCKSSSKNNCHVFVMLGVDGIPADLIRASGLNAVDSAGLRTVEAPGHQ